MEKILKKMGLNEKEIRVYKILLEFEGASASFIAQKSGVNRSTVYHALEALLEKNIIYQNFKADIRHFNVFPPEKLLEYLDQRSIFFEGLKSEVHGILPELQNLRQSEIFAKPKIQFFEGQKNCQDLLLYEILKNKSVSGNIIYAILSMEDVYQTFGQKFFEKSVKKRIQNNIWLHVLRSSKKDILDIWESSVEEKRTVKFFPENMNPPDMSFYLFDANKVAFFSSRKENFALLIESQEFYETQKLLFDGWWKNLS